MPGPHLLPLGAAGLGAPAPLPRPPLHPAAGVDPRLLPSGLVLDRGVAVAVVVQVALLVQALDHLTGCAAF